MDGILNINKPAGETSFGVVAMVRRLCRERHVGHAGTLDPLATGVLPLLLGKGTRVAEYFLEQPKKYLAEVEFGFTSDSGDADGAIARGGEVGDLAAEDVASALTRFRGRIEQIPPMYSALKRNGRPLYELARAGVTVERPSRTVEIYDIALTSWNSPVAVVEVTCSRGTYIRTLAQDLGQALTCGAYLKSLIRLKYGPLDISTAVSVSGLAEAAANGDIARLLQPVDIALSHLPSIVLDPELERFFRHGRPFAPSVQSREAADTVVRDDKLRYRAYALDGSFLGVLRFNSEKDEWQPEKVFP